MQVPENDQVGQVRTWKQQRGIDHGAVAVAPLPRRVHHDWCQEGDRGVEVQDSCHERDSDYGADEQRAFGACSTSKAMADRGKETVAVSHDPDEQQSSNEDEWGPILCSCRLCLTRSNERRNDDANPTEDSEKLRPLHHRSFRAGANDADTFRQVLDQHLVARDLDRHPLIGKWDVLYAKIANPGRKIGGNRELPARNRWIKTEQ